MKKLMVFSKFRAVFDRLTTYRRTHRGAALALVATLVITGVAVGAVMNIFARFRDDMGHVQSATADPSTNNASNKFFDPSVGTNGQACVTCHQPNQGITISVAAIQKAFQQSKGFDPLFRTNDTADRPDADVSRLEDRRTAFKLFLNMGVVRIGKTIPPASDFTIEPQDTTQFGVLPSSADIQHPGTPSVSLFRRPLVNTNVNFDSSVLWDGRANINNMQAQVTGAIQTLLLGPGTDTAANQQIINFMTGVFTDQVSDDGPLAINHAGSTSADGATSGVQNLLALASDPLRPCLTATTPTPGPSTVPTIFTPITCTPSSSGMTLFNAWVQDPTDTDRSEDHDKDRAAIARGQEIFNTVVLHNPVLPGGVEHCIGCHSTNNLGNNPNGNFFVRIGTDSLAILTALRDGTNNVPGVILPPNNPPHPELQSLIDRVSELPLYCLRPNTDPTPFTVSPCGSDPVNHPGDVKTTDPGRALVTGHIADVGRFKPPILRDLSVRSPYFHAGAAENIDHLIDFYNARFNIGLTPQQHKDLAAFIESL